MFDQHLTTLEQISTKEKIFQVLVVFDLFFKFLVLFSVCLYQQLTFGFQVCLQVFRLLNLFK